MAVVVLGVADFPGIPKAVAIVREYVADLVTDDGLTEDLRLLTSETVTNAIAHTASKDHIVTVAVLHLNGVIRVEVIDAGHAATVPHVVDDPDAVAGRGLLLVDQIAHRWGTWIEDPEHCVWFEVATTQTRRALEVETYASPHPSTACVGGGSLKGVTPHRHGEERTASDVPHRHLRSLRQADPPAVHHRDAAVSGELDARGNRPSGMPGVHLGRADRHQRHPGRPLRPHDTARRQDERSIHDRGDRGRPALTRRRLPGRWPDEHRRDRSFPRCRRRALHRSVLGPRPPSPLPICGRPVRPSPTCGRPSTSTAAALS